MDGGSPGAARPLALLAGRGGRGRTARRGVGADPGEAAEPGARTRAACLRDGFLRAARRTKPRAGIGPAGGGAGPLLRARHRHGVSLADSAKPAAVRAPRLHGAGGSARAPALVPAMNPPTEAAELVAERGLR